MGMQLKQNPVKLGKKRIQFEEPLETKRKSLGIKENSVKTGKTQ